MADMALIAGAVTSLKSAYEISKALVGVRDAAMLNDKVIELQRVILAAQSSALAAQSDQFTLLERVRELEKQVAQLEAWDAQKQRYELTEISAGAFAYVVKASMRGAEPTHCICSECYEHGHRSILQIRSNIHGSVTLRCAKCKTEFSASEEHPNYPLTREYAEDPNERARGALESCPICSKGKLAVRAVKPHPIFGDVGGLQVRTLKCDNVQCGHSEERDHDPNKSAARRF